MVNKQWVTHHTAGWSSGEGFSGGCDAGDSTEYGFSLLDHAGELYHHEYADRTTNMGACGENGRGFG